MKAKSSNQANFQKLFQQYFKNQIYMRTLVLCLFLLSSNMVFSQHRIAIYNVEIDGKASRSVTSISNYIVGSYASDDRFIVIDKANIQLIENEQNRQKSEEFIDGYIVKQGVQEGFDYCYYPKYTEKTKSLSIKVYDVAKGTVISNQTVDLKKTDAKRIEPAINKVVDKVNADCFELRYEILRCTDKKKKAEAKDLLFAVGYNQRAKEDDTFEIYVLVEEKIGNRTLERKEVIGKGKIKEVQDGNFSTLRVSKGGSEIMNALKTGNQLYGSMLKSK